MRHKIKRKSEEEKSSIRTSPELFLLKIKNSSFYSVKHLNRSHIAQFQHNTVLFLIYCSLIKDYSLYKTEIEQTSEFFIENTPWTWGSNIFHNFSRGAEFRQNANVTWSRQSHGLKTDLLSPLLISFQMLPDQTKQGPL